MRYLKIFNNKTERDSAVQSGTLNENSVTIWGTSNSSNGYIEYGVGNGQHSLSLGYNDLSDNDNDSSAND